MRERCVNDPSARDPTRLVMSLLERGFRAVICQDLLQVGLGDFLRVHLASTTLSVHDDVLVKVDLGKCFLRGFLAMEIILRVARIGIAS